MTMPSTRTKRRLLTLAGLLAVGVLTYALWPRGPQLELYTSPPLVTGEKTLRVQLLIPAGWIASPSTIEESVQGTPGAPKTTFYGVRLVPREKMTGLTSWLHHLLLGPAETDAEIRLSYTKGPVLQFHGVKTIERGAGPNARTNYTTTHRPEEEKLGIDALDRLQYERPYFKIYAPSVTYTRSHFEDFDATYCQIRDSFKVIQ